MSRITTYANSPSPQLLEKIGATNLTLADAVAEIVANSFDAALDGEPVVVEVTVDGEEICVVDSGAGMSEDVLVEAVKLGVDMADVVKKPPGAKGRFGLGMNTACASIGRWSAVYTRPLGAHSEFRVVFDLAEWERRPNVPEAWTIDIEELDLPTDGPLGDREHGTAVVVKKLRQQEPLAGAVLAKLGEAFKPHLQQGDSILVNGVAATPHNYDFVANSKVPIDIAFGPAHEFQITGWVAIDKQTHNDGDYGFNIYRHGQLVQTWCQEWFAAHLMTSRIIGEVNMDFIGAAIFSQGLQQSDLRRQASAEMKEFLKPVVMASRELSRGSNFRSPDRARQIIDELHDALGLESPERQPSTARTMPSPRDPRTAGRTASTDHRKGGGANTGTRYTTKVRRETVQEVFTQEHRYRSRWAAITAIAAESGMAPETLRRWVRRAGARPASGDQGLSGGGARVTELEREVRQLRRDIETLKASGAFTKAEKLRPGEADRRR